MRPKLIHPSKVSISRVDKLRTNWDPDFNAAMDEIKYMEPETVMAQVKYYRFNAEMMLAHGDSPITVGHLVMYPRDAASFSKGDKIVDIDGFPIEAYIKESRPAAHTVKGPQLVFLIFEDRRKGT